MSAKPNIFLCLTAAAFIAACGGSKAYGQSSDAIDRTCGTVESPELSEYARAVWAPLGRQLLAEHSALSDPVSNLLRGLGSLAKPPAGSIFIGPPLHEAVRAEGGRYQRTREPAPGSLSTARSREALERRRGQLIRRRLALTSALTAWLDSYVTPGAGISYEVFPAGRPGVDVSTRALVRVCATRPHFTYSFFDPQPHQYESRDMHYCDILNVRSGRTAYEGLGFIGIIPLEFRNHENRGDVTIDGLSPDAFLLNLIGDCRADFPSAVARLRTYFDNLCSSDSQFGQSLYCRAYRLQGPDVLPWTYD